jgi:hypothetical protein
MHHSSPDTAKNWKFQWMQILCLELERQRSLIMLPFKINRLLESSCLSITLYSMLFSRTLVRSKVLYSFPINLTWNMTQYSVRLATHHQAMARPQVVDGGDYLQICRVAASILNKQSRMADKG